MARPLDKNKGFETFLDKYSLKVYGRSRMESIANDICLKCGESAVKFKDSLSEEEYTISGFCQVCQDEVFGDE